MAANARDGMHGFGFGVTGAQLRALIAARGLCPGCAGNLRQWCVHTRSSIACSACSGGALTTHATGSVPAVVALAAVAPSVGADPGELAAD